MCKIKRLINSSQICIKSNGLITNKSPYAILESENFGLDYVEISCHYGMTYSTVEVDCADTCINVDKINDNIRQYKRKKNDHGTLVIFMGNRHIIRFMHEPNQNYLV